MIAAEQLCPTIVRTSSNPGSFTGHFQLSAFVDALAEESEECKQMAFVHPGTLAQALVPALKHTFAALRMRLALTPYALEATVACMVLPAAWQQLDTAAWQQLGRHNLFPLALA